MTQHDLVDDRERLSRLEAIAYIECLLQELITLAASEPELQASLRKAHAEAKAIVGRQAETQHPNSEIS